MTAGDRDESLDEVGAAGTGGASQGFQAVADPTASSSSTPKEDAQALELRAAPAAVTRLNRRTLMALLGGAALLVMMATIWSLQPRERKGADPTELYNVDRISRAEGLAMLPSDYSQLPQPKLPELPPVFARQSIPKKIVIGDDVWIGAGAVIMPGVTIARGTVIGANAVVTRDTEEYAVMVGAPARMLRKRDAA